MCSNKATTNPGPKVLEPLLLPIAAGIVMRQIREAKNLTQADLAILADMNLSYISNVENGQSNISIVKLSLISSGLGVQADAVLGRAHSLILPLGSAIRNRTPRDAARMIRNYMPMLLDVTAIIERGIVDSPRDIPGFDELEAAARLA